jgi:hypothetical protein
MKYWEIIVDNLSTSGWTWGCSSHTDSGRALFTADAHRGNGERFIVSADQKLTAFLELESQVLKAMRARYTTADRGKVRRRQHVR